MFSLQKLIVLALIVAAVWYGFKFIGRLEKAGKEKAKVTRKAPSEGSPKKASAGAEEMERCAACGTYVAARGAAACGREDCPYPG